MLMRSLFLVSMLLALVSAARASVSVVYDFRARFAEATVRGALGKPGASKQTSGGVQKDVVAIHPSVGDCRAEYPVRLPKLKPGQRLVFSFSVGLSDAIPENGPEHPWDGVRFAVEIDGRRVWEGERRAKGWLDATLDLSSFAGRKLAVVLITNPISNSNYDWNGFGEPRIFLLEGNEIVDGIVPGPNGVAICESSKLVKVRFTPLDRAGKPVGETVERQAAVGMQAIQFDFFGTGADRVRIDSDGGRLSASTFPPKLELGKVCQSTAMPFPGLPLSIRAIVKNVGEGPLVGGAASAVLNLSKGLALAADISRDKPVPRIGSGEEAVIEWKLAEVNPGIFPISVSLGRQKVPYVLRVFVAPDDMPPVGEMGVSDHGRYAYLWNKDLLVAFSKDTKDVGWMAALYAARRGEWERIGTIGPICSLTAEGTGTPLHPQDPVRLQKDAEKASLIVNDTPRVTFTVGERGGIDIESSLSIGQPAKIMQLAAPVLLIGDGTFGEAKDEAHFPGLEYLLADESSSGTEFVWKPKNLRIAPHPNRVTIPIMALRHNDLLVSLSWDPMQKWDGRHDRPTPMFASPNFMPRQDNHMMGLFVPTVPDWVTENQLHAEKPYEVGTKTRLAVRYTLDVRIGSSSALDALAGWILEHPESTAPIANAMSFEENVRMCVKSLLESSWDPENHGWKHTNTYRGAFDPGAALPLWRFAARNEGEMSSRAREQVKDACSRVGPQALDMAFYLGGLEKALEMAKGEIKSLIAAQQSDGSWAWHPADKQHAIFGRDGDTSSGHSWYYCDRLLRLALLTGDPEAARAGLKGIGYLDTQVRPEGAQTWELQLHVPDILASSHCTSAYLNAYILTGERRYLDKAVYWAKTGLPFIYFWTAADQPIMRFGGIPVFGATHFQSPWFGVVVQWCALHYAYPLQKLAEYDRSFPWHEIAAGITACGIQQQQWITENYPQDYGMFPDAYSPIKGKEEYHWDLCPILIAKNVWRLVGMDPYPECRVLEGKITLAGPGVDAPRMSGSTIIFDVRLEPGATSRVLLSGTGRPKAVRVEGESIAEKPDLEQDGAGWKYLDSGHLMIKLEHRGKTTRVEIERNG